MKILLIRDFGGNFSNKLYNKITKEDFDFVLCNGDIASIKEIRYLFFKYGKDYRNKFPEIELDKIRIKGLKKADKVCEKLNRIGKKVFLVAGNNERVKYDLFLDILKKYKNLKNLDSESIMIEDITIFGYQNRESTTESSKLKITDNKLLIKLKKLQKTNLIILTHFPPYNCRLDKLPPTNPINPNKHIGSKIVKEIIDKFKPKLVICGHLEEYQDRCHIGKTEVINPGPAEQNKYAILDINKNLENYKIIFKSV